MAYTSTYSGDFVNPTLRSHDRFVYHRYLGPIPQPYYSTNTVKSDPLVSIPPSFRLPPPTQPPRPLSNKLPPIQYQQHGDDTEPLETEREPPPEYEFWNSPPPHSYLHMRGAGYKPPRKLERDAFPQPKPSDSEPQHEKKREKMDKPSSKETDKENIIDTFEEPKKRTSKLPFSSLAKKERSYDVITFEPNPHLSDDHEHISSTDLRRGKKMFDNTDKDTTTNRLFHVKEPGKSRNSSAKPPFSVVNRRQLKPQLIKSEQLDSQRPASKRQLSRRNSRYSARQGAVPPILAQSDDTVLKPRRKTWSVPPTPLRYAEQDREAFQKMETARPGSIPRDIRKQMNVYDKHNAFMNQESQRNRNIANDLEAVSERIADYATAEEDLKIIVLDLLPVENGFDHHTIKFDAVRNGSLVVRRGQTFDILVKFNREFVMQKDSLRFTFETGNEPSPVRGSYIKCLLGNKENQSRWRVMIKKRIAMDEILLFVSTPPDCLVSNWRMTVETVEINDDYVNTISPAKEIYFFILFNPWCQDDCVYFPDNKLLEEYVNNDSGVIFQGNYKQIGAKPWFFGQFEEGILEASLYCMQKGFNFNFDYYMGDPIRVSRAISSIVNSQDDKGILIGNWTNNYTAGVSPLKWSGSVAILKEYMETNSPVKFGQCFVFSGIVTTICRAIGIPCRSVTNFSSAHDTDGSTTIDTYWDLEKGEKISLGESKDSIWNFHVWNDVWMKRRDLPPQFSGWQAIDSTPQERSNGKMQCGPASLHGIKEGMTEEAFDSPFVFAEVNGDKINWARQIDGRRYVLSIDSSAVGKKISTKIPDGKPVPGNLTNVERIRHDITHQYKYEEETDRERVAATTAQRLAHGRKPYYNIGRQDITFDGFEKLDYIMIGSDFEIGGMIRNTGNEMRTVEVKFICEAISYKGHRLNTIKQQSFNGILQPRNANKAAMEVKYDEYAQRLNEQACMKVSLIIRVLETGQKQAWTDDFRLRRPDLNVQMRETNGRILQPMECKVLFKNPLPYTSLTNCTVTLEGAGFMEAQRHMPVVDIPPNDRWSAVLTLTPTKPGRRQVFVTFNSDIIQDISGAAEVTIE